MNNTSQAFPSAQVVEAEQSAQANALRTLAIVRQTKVDIKILKGQIDIALEGDKDFMHIKDQLKGYNLRLKNRRAAVLETVHDLVQKLESKKSSLKAEQSSLFGWIDEHVKATGQLSLFDQDQKKVIPIVASYKLVE
jgi:hypothetical protein